jgi:hypothetical protein
MLAPVSLSLLGGFRAERNGEPISAGACGFICGVTATRCAVRHVGDAGAATDFADMQLEQSTQGWDLLIHSAADWP